MPIRRYNGENFSLHVPVCIVGGGACGLTAAVAAAQGGAPGAVFEADTSPRGATAMSYGTICGAGTKKQAELGIDDSHEALFEDIMRATQGRTDEALARVFAQTAGPAVDWLCDDLGFDLSVEVNWGGYGHREPRGHGTPNRNGEELIAMLINASKACDVDIVTEAEVKDLIVADGGKIAGLVYESPAGEEAVGCDALILASSGYGANAELVGRHIPTMANAKFHGCEHHRGDALMWGEALGAEIEDLGAYQGLGSLSEPEAIVVPHTVLIDGGVQVNRHGRRFEHELENISGQAREILKQPDGVCWMIYDQRGHEKARRLFAEYRDGEILNAYRAADTLETLAAKAGIDPGGLVETMAGVDALIKTGEPDAFGRRFADGQRLAPPYYAVKVTGALFHTQGGLCIDETARVKRKTGGVFPNLFAGGGAARGLSGPDDWGYLPAMGLATAVVFGRIAGVHAAQYAANGAKDA